MLSSPSSSSNRSRKDVATRACESCRRRKTKCDEKRPKCGLCQRLNLDCRYQDADEPKQDERTLGTVRIIEALQRVEAKLDSMSVGSGASQRRTAPAWSPLYDPQFETPTEAPSDPMQSAQEGQGELSRRQPLQTRSNLTIPHKIILWPTIYSQLVGLTPQVEPDLQAMYEGGTLWLIRREIERQDQTLPFDHGLPSVVVSSVDIGQASFRSRVSFPSLTIDDMNRCTNAYFGTFNIVYPILDYGLFATEILEPVIRTGFGYGDAGSVLALLVFALGTFAVANISGMPVPGTLGMPSGTRGGTVQNAPGLQLFNEARARLGSISFRCDIISVQIQLLTATYFEANDRHVEFWHASVTASMICHVVVSSHGLEWHTLQGDVIKRAYWTCVISEDLYHLDCGLARTAIHELEDIVPLPHFDSAQSRTHPAASEGTDIEALLQYYFIAKTSLKRIILRIHEGLRLYSNSWESLDDYRGPPVHVIRELSRQLESWRALLPVPLQWLDEDLDTRSEAEQEAIDPVLATGGFDDLLTATGRDLLIAELRTRFYYARYILYQPFIFKALHFPQLMNDVDEQYCASAVRNACLWPVTMARIKTKKRLVPHLFSWTQHFVGILLVLWTSQRNQCLHRICEERLDRGLLETSTGLMLQWIADVTPIDGSAEWSLRLLKPLFLQAT